MNIDIEGNIMGDVEKVSCAIITFDGVIIYRIITKLVDSYGNLLLEKVLKITKITNDNVPEFLIINFLHHSQRTVLVRKSEQIEIVKKYLDNFKDKVDPTGSINQICSFEK